MPEKGRLRLFVCGPHGRHPLIRLTRYRAAKTPPSIGVTRGAALSIADTEQAADGLRVTPDQHRHDTYAARATCGASTAPLPPASGRPMIK